MVAVSAARVLPDRKAARAAVGRAVKAEAVAAVAVVVLARNADREASRVRGPSAGAAKAVAAGRSARSVRPVTRASSIRAPRRSSR